MAAIGWDGRCAFFGKFIIGQILIALINDLFLKRQERSCAGRLQDWVRRLGDCMRFGFGWVNVCAQDLGRLALGPLLLLPAISQHINNNNKVPLVVVSFVDDTTLLPFSPPGPFNCRPIMSAHARAYRDSSLSVSSFRFIKCRMAMQRAQHLRLL